jgi:hypothetical protein
MQMEIARKESRISGWRSAKDAMRISFAVLEFDDHRRSAGPCQKQLTMTYRKKSVEDGAKLNLQL